MNKPTNEIWKDIPGYEGLYQVSNLGRVRSLDRVLVYANGVKHRYKGKIRTPVIDGDGYETLQLGQKKHVKVHRLVATCFIPNPNHDKFNMINHKDENPRNNKVDNLEWCDCKYNLNYGNRAAKYSKSRSKKVALLDSNGKIEKVYSSSELAGIEHCIPRAYIRRTCEGYQKTSMGRKWIYINQ